MVKAKLMIHASSIPRLIGRFAVPIYFAVCAISISEAATAQRVTEIFTPNHRVAEELIGIAEGSLGSEGQVILDQARNSLILIGAESRVGEALSLLRLQDEPVPFVTIRYRSLNLQSLSTSGLAVSWQAEPGVGIARLLSHPDSAISGRLYRTSENNEVTGVLRIQSGREGHIGRGRSVPLPVRDRLDRVVSGFVEAERGFSASPRVLGDGRIRLEITSSIANVDDRGNVQFTNAETIVIADPGETLVIGSLAEGSASKQRGGESHSTRANRAEDVFLITVDVVDP